MYAPGSSPVQAGATDAVEWADASYYLPKESAYQEGRWETLPFQRAIMNAMGSDYIREVNVVKSARVGYSKCCWVFMLLHRA
ncbi:phage terminase large subunit family protein [Escherichia coli]|nr:phage terminase large subunit family protein [Escherichia coli]